MDRFLRLKYAIPDKYPRIPMAYRIRHPRKESLLEAARPSGSKRVSGVAYFRFSNFSPT